MPRYRVTLTRTTVEIVEAPNPYQAAIVASRGEDAEVMHVAPAVGRPAGAAPRKTTKKAVKKRKPLSPEARARLAQNLVKARAARAAKAKAAKKPTRKAAKKTRATKKTVRKAPAKKAKRAEKR
jgi:hypothetical protein